MVSPTAHMPVGPPTRMWSSTGRDRADASSPTEATFKPGQVRPAAGGHQQPLGHHGSPPPSPTANRSAVVVDRLDGGPGATSMPSAANTPASSSPGLGLLGPTSSGRRLEDGDLGAEAAEHLGQLDADGPAAEHGQRGRHLLGLDGLPVGPVGGVGQPGHRWDPGPRTDVDHDGPGGLDDAVAHRHRVGPSRRPQPRTRRPPLSSKRFDRHGVVPAIGGLLADPPGHRAPSRGHRDRAGHPRDPSGLGQEVGGPDHHLGGDAPPVGALAPHQLRRPPRPRRGRPRPGARPRPPPPDPCPPRPRRPVRSSSLLRLSGPAWRLGVIGPVRSVPPVLPARGRLPRSQLPVGEAGSGGVVDGRSTGRSRRRTAALARLPPTRGVSSDADARRRARAQPGQPERWRAMSKQAMAPAVATLSDERVPCWGIDASASHRFRVRGPARSPPTRAPGPPAARPGDSW